MYVEYYIVSKSKGREVRKKCVLRERNINSRIEKENLFWLSYIEPKEEINKRNERKKKKSLMLKFQRELCADFLTHTIV